MMHLISYADGSSLWLDRKTGVSFCIHDGERISCHPSVREDDSMANDILCVWAEANAHVVKIGHWFYNLSVIDGQGASFENAAFACSCPECRKNKSK